MSIRMRHTKGHRGNRRSHHSLEKTRVSTDKNTGGLHMRHRASLETGTYRGKVVLDRVNAQNKADTGSSSEKSDTTESTDTSSS